MLTIAVPEVIASIDYNGEDGFGGALTDTLGSVNGVHNDSIEIRCVIAIHHAQIRSRHHPVRNLLFIWLSSLASPDSSCPVRLVDFLIFFLVNDKVASLVKTR